MKTTIIVLVVLGALALGGYLLISRGGTSGTTTPPNFSPTGTNANSLTGAASGFVASISNGIGQALGNLFGGTKSSMNPNTSAGKPPTSDSYGEAYGTYSNSMGPTANW